MRIADPDEECICGSGLRWADCCARSLPLTLRYIPVKLLDEDDGVLAGCRQGGHCCKEVHVPVTPFDAFRLSRRLEISTSTFLSEFVVVNGDGGIEIDGDPSCPFLDGNICSVYTDRPDSCRMYPFWRVPVGGQDYFVERHTCEGCWRECRHERLTVRDILFEGETADGHTAEMWYQNAILQLERAGQTDEEIENFMSDVYDSDHAFDELNAIEENRSSLLRLRQFADRLHALLEDYLGAQ